METQDYSIEQLNADNLEDLYRLFESVYGRKQQPGFFHRKYDSAYTGHSYIGYFAYAHDRTPVAFYGVIPCFLRHSNQRLLAAQSTDTMTHPGYRFKGMFMELSNRCFELCRDHGILLLFGFPNQNSYHGALKLGWIMTGSMEYFSLPAAKRSFEGLSAKSRASSALYKWYCNRVLRKYSLQDNGLPNGLISEGFTGIDRDNAFLQYKTYSDTLVLQIRQSKVWVKIKNGLTIGDIQPGKDEDFDALIQSLLRLCHKLGLSTLTFHTSPGTHLHRLFTSRYPAHPSFPMLFQDFGLNYPLENIRFTFADIDIF